MVTYCAICGELVAEYECNEEGIPTKCIFDEADEHVCEEGKMYKEFDTGEVYTLEELEEAFEQFKDEMAYTTFDEYMEEMLRQGREKVGGLVEA